MLPDHASHRQLHNFVADQLRTAIFEGKYKPGEWLRQEKLAQELNVSQMPVREALKELAAEGLIEHVPYRGVRVIEFSIDDISELYEHRAYLESRAAANAAKHITDEELQKLRMLLAEMENFSAPEHVITYREINRKFHQMIFLASRNNYLIRSLQQMWANFPTMLIGNFAQTAAQPVSERDIVDIHEHQAILNALLNHDSEAVEQAMKAHILSAGNYLYASLRKQG